MAKTSDSANNAPTQRRTIFSRKPKTPKPEKQPGRMKQMLDVFKMTRRSDPSVVWLMLLVFLGVIALTLIISFFLFNNNWVTALILGIPLGLLGALLILSRRAERAAFSQIEGKPGASGAALNTLRRGWVIEEQPVAVNPRSQDAIFRAVGRPGVVLVTEGAPHRVRILAEAERKKMNRILPNVSVHIIQSGREEGQVELSKVAKQVKKLKNELTKAEVNAVSKRIASLGSRLPIPKGIDPYKARPDRKAARGR